MQKQGIIAQFDADQPPILTVVVDTEEEYDWKKDFSRLNTSIQALRSINRVQDIFDEYHIRPVYVSSFPIVSQSEGVSILKEIQDSDRGLVGAHLHPWVNPPDEEQVSRFNSYPGNLPYELENSKLELLTREIIKNFDRHPAIYKAGRYGVGKNTASILERLGYQVDVSICPAFDYRVDGGPDFSLFSPEPYWFGKKRKLLELPLTGAFIGFMRRYAATSVFNSINSPALSPLRLRGIFARLNTLDRLRLSPESFTSKEHVKLTKGLLNLNIKTFSWTFHSPSIEIGCTPYVTSRKELDNFLSKFRRYFDYFFGKLKGITLTPLEIKEHLEKTSCNKAK